MSLSLASNHSDDSSVGGGDDESTVDGSLKTYQTEDDSEKAIQEKLTKNESQAVFRLRVVVIIVLMATAAAVTAAVYEITRHGESETSPDYRGSLTAISF